ncbi:YtxH domain-containing protein [bacterium]|nr:MAG: YtxH domain-containing protein [bacterium]
MDNYTKGFVTGIFTGAVAGAVVALLFAPESGKNLRKKLSYQLGALMEELDDIQMKITDRKKVIGNNEAKLKGDKVVAEAQKRAEDLIREAEDLIKAIEAV